MERLHRGVLRWLQRGQRMGRQVLVLDLVHGDTVGRLSVGRIAIVQAILRSVLGTVHGWKEMCGISRSSREHPSR